MDSGTARDDEMRRPIEETARGDGRYRLEAFLLVLDGLQRSVRAQEAPRHVSAKELLEGVLHAARDRFGPMALQVIEEWGVRSTRAFGEIVYLLIDAGTLSADDDDRIEDFDEVFDLSQAFG